MTVAAASSTRARVALFNLFVAFAFTIMADPVSSVAYALEAALGELDGELASLFPTMALVIGIIALVAAGYHDLIARFPNGGGGPEGLAAAFGEGWAFLPLGALLVDFTLTIAVSCAAAASAVIAYLPGTAALRVPLALALVVAVGASLLLGHRARVVFGTATLVFVAATAVVIVQGAGADPAPAHQRLAGDASLLPMLLLAAAASSYLAGSGLLKALAAHGSNGQGLLPRRFRVVNAAYVPPWGIALLAGVSIALVGAAGGHEQALVQYYAVAVFASFFGALLASAVLSRRDGRPLATAIAAAGTLAVATVLVLNLRRLDPIVSLGAALALSFALWRIWVAHGRPGGVASVAR
jgi:hypothetical protein